MTCLSIEDIAKLKTMMGDEAEFKEITEDRPAAKGTGVSYEIVSTVAYLIGVPEDQFGGQYLQTTFHDLEKDPNTKTIRSLCQIRSGIMRNIGTIINLRRNTLTSLNQMPEFIPPSAFDWLLLHNISINTAPRPNSVSDLITQINLLIANNIDKCKKALPLWISWDHIKAMFIMPKGSKKEEAEAAAAVLQHSLNSYPFQCYINWPINKPEAYVVDIENHLDARAEGNILSGDRRFLELLYRVNNDCFTEFHRIKVADEETRQTITDFMEEADQITILVDCENSDPYKFCACMRYLKEDSIRHGESNFSKIGRIILFDDDRTIDAWDVVKNYVNDIPVVHEEIERVIGHKSLVDIAMTAGACKEYYRNNIKHFLIVSSDSDYWGVIRSLPEAQFMVMAEEGKFSELTKELYDERGIEYCIMDQFATNINDIKRGALDYSITNYINERLTINIDDMLGYLLGTLRIQMSDKERDNTRKQLCSRLKLEAQADGNLKMKLVE